MILKIAFLSAMLFSTASMASSLTLPHPDYFKGEWLVSTGENLCNVNFSTEISTEANGLKLTTDEKQGKCESIKNAVAWRPSPDGISLLDQDGNTLIFFSMEDGVYRRELPEKIIATLKRRLSIN